MLKFLKSTCMICGDVKLGECDSQFHFCGRHRQDEIDFLQSLPDGKLTKEQKAQRAIYRRRWSVSAALKEPPCS